MTACAIGAQWSPRLCRIPGESPVDGGWGAGFDDARRGRPRVPTATGRWTVRLAALSAAAFAAGGRAGAFPARLARGHRARPEHDRRDHRPADLRAGQWSRSAPLAGARRSLASLPPARCSSPRNAALALRLRALVPRARPVVDRAGRGPRRARAGADRARHRSRPHRSGSRGARGSTTGGCASGARLVLFSGPRWAWATCSKVAPNRRRGLWARRGKRGERPRRQRGDATAARGARPAAIPRRPGPKIAGGARPGHRGRRPRPVVRANAGRLRNSLDPLGNRSAFFGLDGGLALAVGGGSSPEILLIWFVGRSVGRSSGDWR